MNAKKHKKQSTLNDVFFMRVNKKWKDSAKQISENNQISLAKFIRDSVDRSIQSLDT